MDSQAVRQRRHRRHAIGDHSMCRPVRCKAARDQQDAAPDDEQPPSVAAAVSALVDQLALEDSNRLWPELEFVLALATRFDRGEPVASQLRPALAFLSNVARLREYEL